MHGVMHEVRETVKAHVFVARKNNSGFSLIELVVTMGIMIILTVGGVIAFTAVRKNAEQAAGMIEDSADVPAPTPAPPAREVAPVDISTGLNVAIIAVVSVAVLVGLFFAIKILRKSTLQYRARLEAEKTQKLADLEQRRILEHRRDHALASIADSELTQARWEMNPEILIDYPEFTNLSAEPVSALTKAYKDAVRKRDEFNLVGDNFSEAQLTSLEESATNLSIKLVAAQEYAKNVGWGRISFAEKKLMKRAKNLIAVASNEATGDHERAAALRGLQGVLDQLREDHGRVINTDKLTQAIEVASRPKELTSGTPTTPVADVQAAFAL
jgi:hypothetical protein